ncbi:MAG: DEAD/DEAH box helicase family protein, partial [Ignavibacteriaceae bacterium]|nr:DEAD/DEAH box helicase family protein [Ignavibacteriaceae bacterium]
IILIIDESHRTAKAEKALEVIKEIQPKLTIEMTATPTNISGTLIEIPLGRVIAEGMIKSEVHINPNSKNIKENKDLLTVALKKRKELKQAYNDLGTEINPLLLIQIPNKKQTDSSNPEDYIIGLLAEHDITERNGKLAIRISGVDIKELDERVKPHQSEIDVLIFKEAIALGWDCPRASIIFLQREWKQERYSFNIQTLGRIMRMPEQMHYPTKPQLNIGYVFSASDNFEIVQELANDYVSNLQMERDEELNTKPIRLTSEFIRRKRELTRLSGDFKKCLFDAASELNLKEEINTSIKQIYKKIAFNGVVKELDKNQKQEIDFSEKTSIKKDIKEITDSYVNFCAEMSSPYARARSTSIIKSSLRSWFKDAFEIGDEDQISVIVMNRSNNSLIKTLLVEAKEKYKN